MKGEEYFKEVSRLTAKMEIYKDNIFLYALDVDDEYTQVEADKMGPLMFNLWENVAKYKAMLTQLEELEDDRFKEKLKGMKDD